MWGIIPAAGAGSRIQPLAFSKELLPVGSRLEGGIERPARRQRVPGRAPRARRRRRGSASSSRPASRTSSSTTAGGVGAGGRRLRRAAAPGGAVRRDLPRPAADRARTRRSRSGCRTPSGSPRTACWRSTRACSRSCSSPSSSPELFDAVVTDEAGAVREIQVKRPDPGSRWIWGAFKMPGRGLPRAARAVAASGTAPTSTSARSSTPTSRAAARATGVRAGAGLRRRRHAERLPRGDPPARARARPATSPRQAERRPRCALGRRAASRGRVPYALAARRDRDGACAALGPWFHNIDLGGVQTAPEHFLGDYPAVKWRRFAHALPRDLRGRTRARHRLQRRLLLDRDEAARRRARGGHRLRRRTTCAQARFAAEVAGLDIEFRELLGLRRGRARRALRPRAVHGRALPPAPPAAGARPDPRACRRRPAGVPVAAARQRPSVDAARRGLPVRRDGGLRRPGYPKLHFVEHRYAGDPTNWWIPNRACAEAMLRSAGLRDRRAPRGGGLRLPRVAAPAAAGERASGRGGARAGGRGDDRSGDDLERAEQQVALGFRDRPGLERRSPQMARARRRRRRAPRTRPVARVLGGISPIDPDFVRNMARQGRARRTSTWSPCTASRSTGTTGRSTSGRTSSRDPARDRAAGLGLRGRRLHLRRRGGAGVRAAAHGASC